MPDLESDQNERTDKAVLWPIQGVDGYGRPKLGKPLEIKVRWVPQQSQATDHKGNTVSVDAAAIVDIDIDISSLMWLGSLNAWANVGSVSPDSPLMQVKTFSRTPDIRGRAFRRQVGLQRLYDEAIALPAAS